MLAARLQADGARVRAYDPVAEEEARKLMGGVEFAASAIDAARGADAVVIVTEWPEFAELDWQELADVMAGRVVIDGRNFLDAGDRRGRRVRVRGHRPMSDLAESRLQALILVGGEGTRLRPLTSRLPKPIVPLVGQPFIGYMLQWLRRHGVDDVVLSCGFMADGVRDVLGDGASFGIRLRYVEEPRPLGTGGALKYAEELLDERFFMLNGDVLTDIDLTAQLAQHERTGARATLALVEVEDPSAYGLVRLRDDGSVSEFLEKPGVEEIVESNAINAGAYILERERARRAWRRPEPTSRLSVTSSRRSSTMASTVT